MAQSICERNIKLSVMKDATEVASFTTIVNHIPFPIITLGYCVNEY